MSHLIKHPAAICSTDPDGQILSARSTADVFEGHLRPRIARRLEDDLRRNYAPDVVLLTCNSIFRGHDGLRESARRLGEQLPHASFQFTARQVADQSAFLVWTAQSDGYCVGCGADSFVICGGKIRMQTIHYDLLRTDFNEEERRTE